ncbi:MAG: GntP family permease [Nocardioides sp.]
MITALAATETPVISSAGNAQLVIAALAGIATVVLLIVLAKLHPFLALMLGSGVLGAVAFAAPLDTVTAFTTGFGSTMGSVGILIALGAMLGKLLADSGGSNVIVDTIISRVGPRGLPWAMALIAAVLGLPLFFEIGVVLLVPVVILVARRVEVPVMRVAIPALAGLSILHGLVPPHPGPLVAIANLNADLGRTLIFGLIVAVPTLIVCGPLLAMPIERWVPVLAPAGAGGTPEQTDEEGRPALAEGVTRRPGFGVALLCIVLPVTLMLARAIVELIIDNPDDQTQKVFDFIGNPTVALLAAVLVAMFFLGRGSGMNRNQTQGALAGGLPLVAGILLIVAAGGGFKEVLVECGVAKVIADAASGSSISPLILAWLVAVGVRLATGSATVATITASGIVVSLASTLSTNEVSLMVLAIGCGSLFFSHVNDAGFWLVKEYFGLTVGQTIKSWSVMETAISVVGLICVLLLNLVV